MPVPALFLSLLILALIVKVGGGLLNAELAKFNKEKGLSVGFRIKRQGMVELVIAFVGFSAGIFDLKKFSLSLLHIEVMRTITVVSPSSFLLKIRLEQSISSFIG
jgi:Kef-type K+ transport system membrane component KefB